MAERKKWGWARKGGGGPLKKIPNCQIHMARQTDCNAPQTTAFHPREALHFLKAGRKVQWLSDESDWFGLFDDMDRSTAVLNGSEIRFRALIETVKRGNELAS
jgi:hypothetical protein